MVGFAVSATHDKAPQITLRGSIPGNGLAVACAEPRACAMVATAPQWKAEESRSNMWRAGAVKMIVPTSKIGAGAGGEVMFDGEEAAASAISVSVPP